jgi:hypothetical protein
MHQLRKAMRNVRNLGAHVLPLVLAVALLLGCAWGQTNQGSIAGDVVDPSGALVANAKIAAKEISTGSTYQTVSSSAGAYRFPNLNIGTYDLTASAAGFKTTHLTGVVVQVATTSSLDIKLQTGTVAETVEVKADAPTVQADSSDVGTVVMQKQVLDLPLVLGSSVQAMRSPEAFVFLIPGTVGYGSASGSGGTFESKISGGQNYSTEILLDGASMARSENGSSFDETAPSVEALGEFKVLTSTIPAEFGRTTGGIETFSTKSGTNNYHGAAYDIFRNEDLDANTWGNNHRLATGAPRAPNQRPLDKQNDYGGTLGGPVVIPHLYNGKDRTFFFFSWEQYRQTQGGVNSWTFPTDAERNGDFSATLQTGSVVGTNPCDGTPIYQGEIFDPATTRTVGGVQCRTAFMNEPGSTGNVIPTSRFSSVGKNILAFYPHAPSNSLVNNFTFPFSFPILDTTTTFRIDQNLTQKHKAYFTYSSRENSRISTTPEFAGPAGFGRTQIFTTHYIRFAEDFTISPTMLNHLSLGYNRTNSKNIGAGVGLGNGQDWDQKLGVTGASGKMFPQITVGESVNQIGDNVDGDTIDNGFRMNETLNWVKGKHDFKFGIDYRYQQYSPLNFQNTSGTFGFGRGQTAATQGGTLNTIGPTGNGIASLLLGQLQTANLAVYASQPRWLRSYIAGFMEDNYKLTPTLTLQLGLRYEIDQPQKEASDNTSNIDLTKPNPGAGGLPGVLVFAGHGTGRNGVTGERWANTWYKDFGPRLGFAWAPSALGGKTVLRGGYGIIYAGLQYADFGGFNRVGFQASPGFTSLDGYSPSFVIDSGFPAVTAPPNLSATQLNFNGPQYIDPSYGRPGMIQNWSFEIQRELASDLILDVAYVGQHSTHLRSNYDAVNSLHPQFLGLGSLLNQSISSPQAVAAGIKPPYSGFPSNAIVAQALVPFPQYFGFNTDGALENLGMSTYNALEASLQRRFRNGLNLMASYTWSKTLTDADSALPFFATLAQSAGPQTVFNRSSNKAISNQDLPQNFVLSYLYELPFGKNKKFLSRGGVVDRMVGGWSVSGVQRYESGQPITFCCATGIPAWAGSILYDRVPGSTLFSSAYTSGHFNPVSDMLFNPPTNPFAASATSAAFIDPNSGPLVASRGSFALGHMPRVTGEVRMPIYASEDFSLLKRTKITESTDILLQVNFIDAFNRHVFNRPPDLNPNDYNYANPAAGAFGRLNIDNVLLGPRKIQLQMKFEF